MFSVVLTIIFLKKNKTKWNETKQQIEDILE